MKKFYQMRKGLFIISILCSSLIYLSFQANGQGHNVQGKAPVLFPCGGFGVDGDAIANMPTPGVGDWFFYDTSPGSGCSVFNMLTTDPYDLNYPMAYHWSDGWQQGTDLTVFTSSNKIDDDPSTYAWGPGSSPNKNEIANATVQFSYGDPTLPGGVSTDLWCSFAADRQVNNGDSYIDFEFLQKPFFMTGTTSGGFTTMGTEGGRTVGDVLITIEFQQGGVEAVAVVRRWQAVGTGYEYVLFTPDEGDVFCTSNTVNTTAPWLPYGQTEYLVNQYAEGAVNLSHIFSISANPCFGIATVFVRTRSSGQTTQSELKDFPGAPYQVGIIADPPEANCPVPVLKPECTPLADLQTAYQNWKNGFYPTPGMGVEPLVEEFSPALPDVLPDDVVCTGILLDVIYSVSDNCTRTSTCSSTFEVTAPDPLVVNCPAPVSLPACSSATAISDAYDAWKDGFSKSGDCNLTDNMDDFPALTDMTCGGQLVFTYIVEGDCDNDGCTSTFTVAVPQPLVVDCPDPVSLPACTSAGDISDAYDAWKAGFTKSGDCNLGDNMADFPELPDLTCSAGQLVFTYIVEGDCDNDGCTSTFTVAAPDPLVVDCPDPVSLPACTSAGDISDAYDAWKAGFTKSGDCNLEDNMADFPDLTDLTCGGQLAFTYIVEGDCDNDGCTSTFTVAVPEPLVVDCPAPVSLPACSSAGDISDAYDAWKLGFTKSGDCNLTDNMADFPDLTDLTCGGQLVFTYIVEGDCDNDGCTSTFTVAEPDPLVVDCPDPVSLPACTSAGDISDAYDAWKLGFTKSGDCNLGDNMADFPALTDMSCGGQLVFTYIVEGDCDNDGCTSTFTVAVPEPLVVDCPDPETMECTSPDAIQAAWDTWRAGFTKSGDCNLTDNLDELPEDAVINPDGSVTLFEFTYIVTGLCDEGTCSSTFVVSPCPKEFCTYTQGFYGSQKGTACDLETERRGDIFTAALLVEGGPLVLGFVPNTVTFLPGDAALIKSILPGGGQSYVLTGACIPSVSTACLPLTAKQGRLSNQLLAQTLTLGLNLRINDGLGAVPLEAGKWLTTQEKLSCEEGSGGINKECITVNIGTTATPVYCEVMDPDPYSYYMLPEVVLDFMAEKGYSMTVQGLFNLANDALGQARTLPTGVTLTKIAGAVDMINNAFDGCRLFVGNLDEKFTCENACPSASGAGKSVAIINPNGSGLNVYPNPFSDKVTFEFTSPVDAHAVLEIHNLLGQKISVLLDRNVEQGVMNRAEYEPAGQVPGILIYQLKLDDSVQTGRLIYNR